MAGYNRVVLVGNLTRDPEYKQLSSGQAVCRLGLATNRQFKNRQSGEMVQEVCYIDIDVWGAQADSCNQYLQKGRSVLVEGRLKLDTWEDQLGNSRNKHSVVADRVVFLGAQVDTNVAVQQNATSSEQKADDLRLNPNNKVEKELIDQLDRVEQAKKGAVKASKKSSAEEIASPKEDTAGLNFKDEPPFEDDLPF